MHINQFIQAKETSHKSYLPTKVAMFLLALFLLGFILLGFYRITFTNQIATWLNVLTNSSQFLESHQNKNIGQTFFVSWLDTIIYSAIHLFFIVGIVFLGFQKLKYAYYSVIFMITLHIFSALLIIAHKVTNYSFFYRFSEDLIYFTLSVSPLFFLGFFFFLIGKHQINN
jgi:hypothetical protein